MRSALAVLFVVVSLCGAQLASAQTLVLFDPGPEDLNPTAISSTDPMPADVIGPNVVVSDLVQNRPSGFFNESPGGVWPVLVQAFDTADYLSFTIEATADNVLNVDELIYNGQSFADSTVSLTLRSSLDGFSSDVGVVTSTGSGFRRYTLSMPLTAAMPRNIRGPVEFRIYPGGGSGVTGFNAGYANATWQPTTQTFGCGGSQVSETSTEVVLTTANNCGAIAALYTHTAGAPDNGTVTFDYAVTQSAAHSYQASVGVAGAALDVLADSAPATGSFSIPVSAGQQVVFDLRKSSGVGVTSLTINNFRFASDTLEFADLVGTQASGGGLRLRGSSDLQGSMAEYRFDRLYPPLQKSWYFSGIDGIAVDRDNYVYVADTGSGRILKYTRTGRLALVFRPQQGAPIRVAVDSRNDVYVTSDTRVEKFDSNGQFITAFGSGLGGPLAIDDEDALYVDQARPGGGRQLVVFMPPGPDQSSDPHIEDRTIELPFVDQIVDLDLDVAGNLYIADQGPAPDRKGRLYKVTQAGNLVWQQGQGPEASLVAYYSFDQEVGAQDVSGNGNHGTLQGTASIGSGRLRQGLDLTGGNGWVDIASSLLDGAAECTISFWMDLQSAGDPATECCRAIYSQDGFNTPEINQAQFSDPDRIEFIASSANSPMRAGLDAPATPSGWNHYAFTYDANAGLSRIFLNGQLVTSQQHDLPAQLCGAGLPSTIGAALDGTDRFLDARLDEMRFYSRAITPGEVGTLANLAQLGDANGDPFGVRVSPDGLVYLPDRGRMLIFDSNGDFVDEYTLGTFRFFGFSMGPIDFAPDGTIFGQVEGDAVRQIRSEDGVDIQEWSQQSAERGRFLELRGMAQDSQGYYYAMGELGRFTKLDASLSLVDVFTRFGEDVAVGDNDRLFITDGARVVALDPPTDPLQPHTEVNSIDLNVAGGANGVNALAVGPSGQLYVTSRVGELVFKLTQDLQLVSTTPTPGFQPEMIGVDSAENLYMIQPFSPEVHKYAPPADVLSSNPHTLAMIKGGFGFARGPVVNEFDEVLVADRIRHEVVVLDTDLNVINKFGERGFDYGFIEQPDRLEIGKDGQLIVIESFLKRFQVFRRGQPVSRSAKAIIVAAGGPAGGRNALWPATQVNANFAYRTLLAQGYDPESIYYISADAGLDITGNGESDVDAGLANANLQDAIATFAADADDLVVYLVDHGGVDNFLMNQEPGFNEILKASVLADWLNDWQAAKPDSSLIVVYDACQSGSFVDDLRKSPVDPFDRIIIASSQPDQVAYFASQGAASFSNSFWTEIFNGKTLLEAFQGGTAGQSGFMQTPLLEGDGVAGENQASDEAAAFDVFIGRGDPLSTGAPQVGSVTPPQVVPSGSSATLDVFDVQDTDGIDRVYALLSPPAFLPEASDNPVVELPTLEFQRVEGTTDYRATYDAFNVQGIYQVRVFAEDAAGNISQPVGTSVTVGQPSRRRAIIVAGSSAGFNNATAISENAQLAYRALVAQGYGPDQSNCSEDACDDIMFLSNFGVAGVDASPSLAELEFAITQWAVGNSPTAPDPGLDLVVYLVGNSNGAGLVLNDSEVLGASALAGWLQTAQIDLPFSIVVVYDGESSGQFQSVLVPGDPTERWIVITTDNDSTECNLVLEPDVSFSRLFWPRILDGATVLNAFLSGRRGNLQARRPTPQLDDNGNGIVGGNEFDGGFARRYTLGSGVLLAGDSPVLGSLTLDGMVTGAQQVTMRVDRATTTGILQKVEAIVTTPDCKTERVLLQEDGAGGYMIATNIFSDRTGSYDVSIYAHDIDGRVSEAATASIVQQRGELLFRSGFE